jgi:hypothetical protein
MGFLAFFLYRWKYGHYPTLCIWVSTPRTPNVTRQENPQRPRGSRTIRRPEAGLPGYTLQPMRGELSLGVGRKRSNDEEYELAETRTLHGAGEPDQTTQTEPQTASLPESSVAASLPPYIPPPEPVTTVSRTANFRPGSPRRGVLPFNDSSNRYE